jgi:hypothetical protein
LGILGKPGDIREYSYGKIREKKGREGGREMERKEKEAEKRRNGDQVLLAPGQ